MIDKYHSVFIKTMLYLLCFFSLIIVPFVWFIDELNMGKKILIAGAGILTWPFAIWFNYWEEIDWDKVRDRRSLIKYIRISWVWYVTVVFVGAALLIFGIKQMFMPNFSLMDFSNFHHVGLGLIAIAFGMIQIRKLLLIRKLG